MNIQRLRIGLIAATCVEVVYSLSLGADLTPAREDLSDKVFRLHLTFHAALLSQDHQSAQRIAAEIQTLAQGQSRCFQTGADQCFGRLYLEQRRYRDAEIHLKRAIEGYEQDVKLHDNHVPFWLDGCGYFDMCHALADAYLHQRKSDEVRKLMSPLRVSLLTANHPPLAPRSHELGRVCVRLELYDEAERHLREAVALYREDIRANEQRATLNMVDTLLELATVYGLRSKFKQEANALREALDVAAERTTTGGETSYSDNARSTCGSVRTRLGMLLFRQRRYEESHAVLVDALAYHEDNIRECKSFLAKPPDPRDELDGMMRRSQQNQLRNSYATAASILTQLAEVCKAEERFTEADEYGQRAEIYLANAGDRTGPREARWLRELGVMQEARARMPQALQLYGRAIRALDQSRESDLSEAFLTYSAYGAACTQQGNYAEGERYLKRALAVGEELHGADDPRQVPVLNALGLSCFAQARNAEGTGFVERALAISETRLGRDHEQTRECRLMRASLYIQEARYVEAISLYEEVMESVARRNPVDEEYLVDLLVQIATVNAYLGRVSETHEHLERALLMMDDSWRPNDHPGLPTALRLSAALHLEDGNYSDAERLLDRAAKLVSRIDVTPEMSSEFLYLRSLVSWAYGRDEEAVSSLWKAIEAAESQQAFSSGGGFERARTFEGFNHLFEKMVEYQVTAGTVEQAFRAIELGRARSLAEQMQAQGADWLDGIPKDEAKQLEERREKAMAEIHRLTRKLEALDDRESDRESSGGHKTQLVRDLEKARRQYANVYADIRNASPAYRLAATAKRAPVPLEELQSWIDSEEAVLLEYFLGEEDGYVLALSRKESPRIERLKIERRAAQLFGVAEGPLTLEKLHVVLAGQNGDGVLTHLRSRDSATSTVKWLAALWRLLIPEKERALLTEGGTRRLIVVPDGELTQLPFEALVVAPSEDPTYLLDTGVALEYAPSATVLHNLANRQPQKSRAYTPVLTVGDPQYHANDSESSSAERGLADPAAAHAYTTIRSLPRLKHSGQESEWVSQVFSKHGLLAKRLDRDRATEANVRHEITGRRFVHLATHGLAEQGYGNMFGFLAFTPGAADSDVGDDGFLTLGELSELDLKTCELAILSACETNLGPQQRGEGVWSISRGFLIAGAQRTVATNWAVNDQATATLVSKFCATVAAALQKGEEVDYAAALQQAKKWVRDHPEHDEWRKPYYWAPFVLIGPR